MQAVLLCAAGAAAAPVLFFFNPANTRVFPPCPFRWLTGWLCPGCGSLRAGHHLLHGEIAAAIALNPVMVLLLPLTLFLLARQFHSVIEPQAPERPLPAPAVWLLLALTLAFTVARNLPAWPAALSAAALR